MRNIDTITSALLSLSVSRCVGANAEPSACPNRIPAVDHGARVCKRCDDARVSILGFVAERVSAIIDGRYGSLSEDIASDVVLDYARRIENGRLMRVWAPGKPTWVIASKGFLQKRIVSALRRYPEFSYEQTLTDLDVTLESLEIAHADSEFSTLDSCEIDIAPALRTLLKPESWKGSAIELVAAMQLYPLMSDAIASNAALIAKLGVACTSTDPIARLREYHLDNMRQHQRMIDRLADKVRKSVTCETAAAYREEIENERIESILTPLSAQDLMSLLALKQDAANKRMLRYREFLEERLRPLLLSQENSRAVWARAGPGAVANAWERCLALEQHDELDPKNLSRSATMAHSRMRHCERLEKIKDIGVAVTGCLPGKDRRLRVHFALGIAGLYLRVGDLCDGQIRAVRMGGFPAFRSSEPPYWRFAQPVTEEGARSFAQGDLVLTMRDGRRFRFPRPLAGYGCNERMLGQIM